MPSLFLNPVDAQWRPAAPSLLVERLRRIGLLGDRRVDEAHVFLAGRRFLQLVSFLGCSPRVAIDPEQGGTGGPACFVRLDCQDRPVFRIASPPPPVRCPGCRASAAGAIALDAAAAYRCRACGASNAVRDLDWRRGAGYASFFLQIGGIHPHEALPSDQLLHELTLFSSCDWQHFFSA